MALLSLLEESSTSGPRKTWFCPPFLLLQEAALLLLFAHLPRYPTHSPRPTPPLHSLHSSPCPLHLPLLRPGRISLDLPRRPVRHREISQVLINCKISSWERPYNPLASAQDGVTGIVFACPPNTTKTTRQTECVKQGQAMKDSNPQGIGNKETTSWALQSPSFLPGEGFQAAAPGGGGRPRQGPGRGVGGSQRGGVELIPGRGGDQGTRHLELAGKIPRRRGLHRGHPQICRGDPLSARLSTDQRTWVRK